MKATLNFAVLCFSFLMLPILAVAQDDDNWNQTYHGAVKVRPLQFGEVYVSWENIKFEDQSNEIGLGFIYKTFVGTSEKDRNTLESPYNSFLDEEKYTISDAAGIVMRMSQRNYTSKIHEIPEGFYYGPVYMYRFIAHDPDLLRTFENEVIGRMYEHVISFHYQIGYQFILGKHFSVEPYFGAGVRGKYATAKISKGRTEERVIAPIKITPETNSTIAVAPSLNLNFSIGYVF
jgi:hypothetical protein